MARYRSKPREVEARQWSPGTLVPGVHVEDPSGRKRENYESEGTSASPMRYFVVTIHRQRAYLDPGDYVITEPDGRHHYPVKPAIFEAHYEPCDASVVD